MTAVFVQLSSDTTRVVTVFGCAQAVTSDKPGYAQFDSSDARYVAWQALQAGIASHQAAVVAGVAISSTGTPALNGVYALDAVSLANITSEQVYIATTGKFTNGGATRNWPDASGVLHLFPSTAEFTAFAEAAAGYVDALATALAVVQGGGAWAAPSMPAALA